MYHPAVERRLWVWLVVGIGCGPQVALSDGTTDEGDSSGTAAAATGDEGVEPTTSPPAPGTESGPADESSGNESDNDGPVPTEECWQVEELFEAPETAGTVISDQDGDGTDELWLSFTDNGGPGPGDTTLFRIDLDGTPGLELPIPGFLISFGDIDGDALQDLVLIDFSGGFPPVFSYAHATGPGAFDFPAIPMELELQEGLSGFFDAEGDGLADVFALQDDGSVDLRLGNGMGAFTVASNTFVGEFESIFVTSVPGAPDYALLGSTRGFGGGGPPARGCEGSEYQVLQATGGPLQNVAASMPAGPTGLGPLLSTRGYDDGTLVAFTGYCDGDNSFSQLRLLSWDSSQMMISDTTLLRDMQWATSGDFDGDGLLDIIFALPGEEQMAWSAGIDPVTFAPPLPIAIDVPDIRNNNVRALDQDGDGRDELLRGHVVAEGNPAQLAYDRVSFGPCP